MMDDTGNTNSDDAIAALVRLAGRRPPVPEEAARRVREAVHDEWMETISRRRRTRWIGSAAVVAAAVVTFVILRLTIPSPPQPRPDRVVLASGQTNGAVIYANIVYEVASGNTASLAWGNAILRLDSGARVRIASPTELTLDRGAVYVDSHHAGVVIHTPLGNVRDIGTQFEVRLAPDRMRVRVREGRVDLQHGGATHSAEAGVELDADAQGGVTPHSIARNGADWDWVVRAAPPIHLDGRTLSEVVASVTRDEGVTPVWSDAASRNAASMRLHGDVPLTPVEALDTALVASGLTARTDGARLIIKRRK
ncbi:MAG TPA: FecR domain-containing protein [Thermoanaerobaculia bacterium]|jgi:ferric-dicitrate binding protein FerR (iron transport regulator)|nr:FecR domain-containing protein [Thermoanaerobaculia bacterium]